MDGYFPEIDIRIERGRGRLLMDGKDITRGLLSLDFHAEPLQAPTLTLVYTPGAFRYNAGRDNGMGKEE